MLSQSRLKMLKRDGDGEKFGSSPRKERISLTNFEADLKKQMQAWKENPVWVDEAPKIKVRQSDEPASTELVHNNVKLN